MGSNYVIVVVAGGHIFVGQLEDRNEQATTLGPVRQFGRLGTTDLVAGLINGPTANTTMMAVMPHLRIPAGQVRFEVQASEEWARHLAVKS
jgi:hypothetical protein